MLSMDGREKEALVLALWRCIASCSRADRMMPPSSALRTFAEGTGVNVLSMNREREREALMLALWRYIIFCSRAGQMMPQSPVSAVMAIGLPSQSHQGQNVR